MELKPYPKIHSLGYRGFERIFDLPIVIQEKFDGSNVSIHRTEEGLKLASRNQWIGWQAPGDSKVFGKFGSWVRDREESLLNILNVGDVLWGEFCNNHNVLHYDRTEPFVMFDFSRVNNFGVRQFINPFHYEPSFSVKLFNTGILVTLSQHFPKFPSKEAIEALLKEPSLLGGRREGIVLKNYEESAILGGVLHELFVKYVNPEYKETHKVVWNQGEGIEETIVKTVYNEARLRKGIQHLREEGRLVNAPQDIGPLIGSVNQDIYQECQEEIKAILFEKYWKGISRIITGKVVKDYKKILTPQLPDTGPGLVSIAGGETQTPDAVVLKLSESV